MTDHDRAGCAPQRAAWRPRREEPSLVGMNGKIHILAAVALSSFALCPGRAQAQGAPLVVELRGGATVPVGDFSDGLGAGEGATSGPAFGVDFAFSGAGRRTIYLGFGQHRFGCEHAGCPTGRRYIATTLDGGVRFSLRSTGTAIPWLLVGGSTTRVESPGVLGSGAGVSERGYGWDVGAGVYVGTSSPIALNPGIRFRASDVDLPDQVKLSMRYLVVDLGVSLAF